MKTKEAPRLPYISCPHCGTKAFARSAGKTTEVYREVYYHCRQLLACGHVFVVAMQVLRTVRVSACPNPAVQLPITHYARPANDDPLPAANDDQPPPSPPVTARMTD
ncbi:ogr/Delta-like zinc finger family protein [Govanella unica]|uniref:Ogr/Delta-like zinc finger family protein n=1 Tax=Govanella unica TaxID=2975056 RepID=A0A9X3Z673_9PROT|nr:ogr/Delta-like zinc finger family protein [Govania unica]MDA5192782.1 ogr/Delta-like zinc finger family protein [Govania unica]